MKRLIVINVLLLLLLNITNNNKVTATQMAEVEIPEQVIQETITSRSLDEVRTGQDTTEIVTGISEKGIEYIKRKEGLALTAEVLQGEVYGTIGYGHHDKDVKAGQTITEEQADTLLRGDLKGYSDYVLSYCEYLELTQNEADALISFCYNLGNGWLSTLTANKTRTKEEIAEHITSYTSKNKLYRAGLLQRRQEEKNIFLGGEY